ncbi:hypothetical protein [Limihaloglobus sulfuriphilus]|uniref:hypothetical protein n=1 Tax=Limihaloglobus sulfuriphilus TaxID=1851148 RepID=UPI0011BA6D24|nr:hypothetical protein [Limihaloglobus sulfuriphilus]
MVLFTAVVPCLAVRTNFIGTGDAHDWCDAASWDNDIPGADDEASVQGDGTLIIDTGCRPTVGLLRGPGRAAGHTTLTIRDELTVAGSDWRAGYFGEGTLNVEPGAVITVNSRIYAGFFGTLHMNMTGGSIYTPGYLQFATGDSDAAFDCNMMDGSISSDTHMYLGTKGDCTVNMTGGQISTPSGMHVFMGFETGTSILTVDGGTVSVGNTLRMADGGSTAILNILSGSVSSSSLYVAHHDGGSATVNVSGGVLSASSGGTGLFGVSTAAINMTGGEFNVSGTFELSKTAGSTAQVNLDGGVMMLGSLTVNDGGLIDIGQGVLKIGGNVVSTVNSYINSGKIIGYGGYGSLSVVFDGQYTVATAGCYSPPGDLNGDCLINYVDFTIFAWDWLNN